MVRRPHGGFAWLRLWAKLMEVKTPVLTEEGGLTEILRGTYTENFCLSSVCIPMINIIRGT